MTSLHVGTFYFWLLRFFLINANYYTMADEISAPAPCSENNVKIKCDKCNRKCVNCVSCVWCVGNYHESCLDNHMKGIHQGKDGNYPSLSPLDQDVREDAWVGNERSLYVSYNKLFKCYSELKEQNVSILTAMEAQKLQIAELVTAVTNLCAAKVNSTPGISDVIVIPDVGLTQIPESLQTLRPTVPVVSSIESEANEANVMQVNLQMNNHMSKKETFAPVVANKISTQEKRDRQPNLPPSAPT